MPFDPGTRLGPYEVLALLGAGGMGEVYRARDTVLGRDVALKVLLPVVSQDADRIARFRREAHVLASLNHPNIATIYGAEANALVMELVEGPTPDRSHCRRSDPDRGSSTYRQANRGGARIRARQGRHPS